MRTLSSILLAAALFANSGHAQKMSGNYTINPNATGSRNFKTFKDAGKALFFFGVDGPVEIRIFPGTYRESFFLLPVEGASETNRITFRPLLPRPRSVKLQGTSLTTIHMFPGVAFLKAGFITLDGLVFEKGGTAIEAGALTEGVVIRNCEFLRAHTPSRGVIFINGASSTRGWKIHHNRFEVPLNRRLLYGSQVGQFDIYANEFDLGNGGGSAIYLINNNRSLNNIYNNLFYGKLQASASVAAIQVNLSNISNTIAHNSFFIETAQGQAIGTFGSRTNFNKIYGNCIFVTGGGTCISVLTTSSSLQHWSSNGNLFWAPGGNIGQIGSGTNATKYPTLQAWRGIANKNQPDRDQASVSANPRYMNTTTSPPDLRLQAGSPVRNAAVKTPAFVSEDFDLRWRDAQPDIGAYELNGFAMFGKGCPGTGNKTPALGATGTVGVGQRFSITCTNGRSNAPALLAFGLTHTRWGSTPLPIQIPGGCVLYVPLDVPFITALDAQGSARVPLTVPNLPVLRGTTFNYQWLIADSASSSSFGFSHSNAGSANL